MKLPEYWKNRIGSMKVYSNGITVYNTTNGIGLSKYFTRGSYNLMGELYRTINEIEKGTFSFL